MKNALRRSVVSIFALSLLLLSGLVAAQAMGFSTTRVVVKPGATGQFERFISNFKAAAEEVDWPNGWNASQVAIGNTNQYLFVAPFSSHSQLSTPVAALLAQAHSPDEVAEIVQDLRESTESLVTGTYYPRADLSHPPAQPLQNQEVIMTIQVNAKPGMEMPFEEWIHRVVDASGDNVTWSGFVKGFGEGPGYVFRIPMTWDMLDQTSPSPAQRVMSAYGPIAGNAIVGMGAEATESRQNQILVPRPDLSYSP